MLVSLNKETKHICLKHTNLKKEKEQRNTVFFHVQKQRVENEHFSDADEKDELTFQR